jgi:hypothetical protein
LSGSTVDLQFNFAETDRLIAFGATHVRVGSAIFGSRPEL